MAHLSQTQIRPTEYMLSRTSILIVDDESGPRHSLKMILSPAHRVLTAASGHEALDILRAHDVDLITIDLQMPGMRGDELMRRVRAEHPSVEIIVITGAGSMQTAVEGLRHGICDYISKPFDVVEVSSAVSRALGRKQSRSRLVSFLEGIGCVLGRDRDAASVLADLTALSPSPEAADTAVAIDAAPHAYPDDPTPEFLDVLAQALESRDGELRKHAQRVGFYADLVAEQLGCDEVARDTIRIASFLHDIGKVGLTDEDKERAQLRFIVSGVPEEEHPEIGAKLVQPLGFDEAVADAIRHHHEHWNGDGEPGRLREEAIPLAARVIAVVDAFDKLTSDGDDGPSMLPHEAAAELKKQAGTRFDPAIVAIFVALVDNGEVEARVEGALA